MTDNRALQITDLELSVGRDDTENGVKVGIDGDAFWRVHITPQGEVLVGDGTAPPEALSTGGGSGDVATDAIWNAVGDLVVATGNNAAVRLPKGAEGTFLRAGAVTVAYAALVEADIPSELARVTYVDDEIAAEVSARNTAIGVAVAALIDAAPGLLDTLNEIAAALGDDPNFATTITNLLALKAPLADPALTGAATLDGDPIATEAHVAAAIAAQDVLAVDLPLSFDPSPPANTQVLQLRGVYQTKGVYPGGGTLSSVNLEASPAIYDSWATTSWARSGTTVTVTRAAHGLTTTSRVNILASSATTPLPNGWYAVASVVDADNFTITGVNSGGTSGTATVQPVQRHLIPANTVGENDQFRARAWGTILQNDTSAVTFRFRINGTASAMFTAAITAAMLPNDSAARPWVMDVEYRINSGLGYSGMGSLIIASPVIAVDEVSFTRRSPGATGQNFAIDNYIDVTTTTSVSSAAAVVTCEGFIIQHALALT